MTGQYQSLFLWLESQGQSQAVVAQAAEFPITGLRAVNPQQDAFQSWGGVLLCPVTVAYDHSAPDISQQPLLQA